MKRLSSCYIFALIAFVSMLLFLRFTVEAQDWGSVSVGQDANGYYAILENSQIRVRYGYRYSAQGEHPILDLIIKSVGEDQAGSYLDACASRGTMTNASVVYDGSDRKTVRLEWDYGGKIQEVSIFPDSPYIKIDYIEYGVNIVDMGSPGGSMYNGEYVFYGGDEWVRGYVGYPDSYYNRYPGDGINDPADGGSLNYHGYFIGGIYNSSNNRGYGRVMPVEAVDIIKLLFNTGLEFFSYYGRGHQPYTGYLYVVTGGAQEIISVGQQLADGGYEPPSGYILTVNVVGVGSVGKDPDQAIYQYGDDVTLTAIADPGWTFAGWSGALSGTDNPATLTITGNTAVTATFTQDEYDVTVTIVGQGLVTNTPGNPYHYNEIATLEPVADAGWTFTGWGGPDAGELSDNGDGTWAIIMDGNKSVTATFTQDEDNYQIFLPLITVQYSP